MPPLPVARRSQTVTPWMNGLFSVKNTPPLAFCKGSVPPPRPVTLTGRAGCFVCAGRRGSVGLADCTAGPDGAGVDHVSAYTALPAYASGNGYGYDTGAYGYARGVPGSTYVASPSANEYGGPAYYGAPAYVGGGYARGPGPIRPRRGLASARVAEQRGGALAGAAMQQEQQNAALYRQQVQQNQATYQRQVQENAAKNQQQVQQNQAIVQQNAARYQQQVQQNTAIYQRQLLEAQQRKALGQ